MRQRISVAVAVVVVVVAPLRAQPSEDEPREGRNYLRHLQAPQPEREAAVSIRDQMAVARFLAETGIDLEDYRTAHLIAQRMAREGVTVAALRRDVPAPQLSAGQTLGIGIGAAALLSLAGLVSWRRRG